AQLRPLRVSPMPDIVVGFDGSDCGQKALEAGSALAKELQDRVVLVYSYHVNPLGGEVQDMASAPKERGKKVLEQGSALVKNAGASVEAELVSDQAADALSDMADQRKARMIVVGTYGDSPIKGAILGSTPHKLLHISDVPVLVVPAG